MHQQGNQVTWVKGTSGNPNGRPSGSKQRLSEDYLHAMARDFKRYGYEVIEKVRKQHPETYLRLVAKLVPKEFSLDEVKQLTVINALPVLTTEQWRAMHGLEEAQVIEHKRDKPT